MPLGEEEHLPQQVMDLHLLEEELLGLPILALVLNILHLLGERILEVDQEEGTEPTELTQEGVVESLLLDILEASKLLEVQ